MLQTAKVGRAPLDLAAHLNLDGSRITIENLGVEIMRFAPGSSGDDAPADLRAGFLLRPGERATLTPAAADAPLWAWGGGRIAVGPALAPAAGGGGGGGSVPVSAAPVTRRAELTLTATQIAGLATARHALLAADPDHTVVPLRLIVHATGGTAPAQVADTGIWVTLAPAAGGLFTDTDGAPDYFTTGPGRLYSSWRGNVSGWLRPGGYTDVWIPDSETRTALPDGGGNRDGWNNLPLTVAGYAAPVTGGNTAAQQWAAATAGIGTLQLKFVLLYELWDF